MAKAKSDEARWARAAEAFANEAVPVHVALKLLDLPSDVFKGADLANAAFDKANLKGFDFSGANLAGASFTGASLNEANFTGANLKGTSFRAAKMLHVKCAKANFDGADLKGARVQVVDEAPASLTRALGAMRGVAKRAPTQKAPRSLAGGPVRVSAAPGKAVTASALLQTIADHMGIKKSEAKTLVEGYTDVVKAYVLKGAKVKIGDIGMVMVRHRKARMGRNPQTGEPVKIKASKKLAFRQSAVMKAQVMGGR